MFVNKEIPDLDDFLSGDDEVMDFLYPDNDDFGWIDSDLSPEEILFLVTSGTTRYFPVYAVDQPRLYNIWNQIIQRCTNPRNKDYPRYGGRGITMCDEWRHDFLEFKNWALSAYYNDTLTIDRIDVNGPYIPSNCRWQSIKKQCNNRRSNIRFTIHGQDKTMVEWCEEFNLDYMCVKKRHQQGWPVERLFSPTKRPFSKKYS
jgi:hypothetical protein